MSDPHALDSSLLTSSMPMKLPFQITSCSSHDDRYPPSSLTSSYSSTSSSSSLHGWQSARGCEYPQTLVLSFGCTVELRKVQVLSHQSKIAKTVELHVGTASNATAQQTTGAVGQGKRKADDVEWSRLGSASPHTSAPRQALTTPVASFRLRLISPPSLSTAQVLLVGQQRQERAQGQGAEGPPNTTHAPTLHTLPTLPSHLLPIPSLHSSPPSPCPSTPQALT